jgi:putative flavoprotein involved in K+ transport
VARIPRRYRGRDIIQWGNAIGMYSQRTSDVPEEERAGRQPMISGTHGGHSLSLHLLGRAGATLLGRLQAIEDRTLRLADDLMANVSFADEVSTKMCTELDAFIEKTGGDAPEAEPDPADECCDSLEEMAAIRSLNLDDVGIRSVIWATGFGGDFSYLPAELLGETGLPKHKEGVCEAPGLYCMGLTWLRTRQSGLIPGVTDDAQSIVALIQSCVVDLSGEHGSQRN